MNLFLKSQGVRIAKVITKEFIEPYGDEDTWPKQPLRTMMQVLKAQYALTQALHYDDLSRVINCKSTYEV